MDGSWWNQRKEPNQPGFGERLAGVGLALAFVALLAMSLIKLGMVWFA